MELKPGIVSIWGPRGSMKSSQGISFPKVVKVFDFDLGIQRAWGMEELESEGLIQIVRMEMPVKSLSTRWAKLDGFKELWLDFIKEYEAACQDPEIKTIQLDTNTMNWQLIRDGYLQELQEAQIAQGKPLHDIRKQILQIEYGEPNQRMRSLFHMAVSAGKWLVLVQHETDEYAPLTMAGQPVIDPDTMQQKSFLTGQKVSDGFKYTESSADWIFRTAIRTEDRNGGGKKSVPYATVKKSALGIDVVGYEIQLDVGEVQYSMFEKLEMYLRGIGRIQ